MLDMIPKAWRFEFSFMCPKSQMGNLDPHKRLGSYYRDQIRWQNAAYHVYWWYRSRSCESLCIYYQHWSIVCSREQLLACLFVQLAFRSFWRRWNGCQLKQKKSAEWFVSAEFALARGDGVAAFSKIKKHITYDKIILSSFYEIIYILLFLKYFSPFFFMLHINFLNFVPYAHE